MNITSAAGFLINKAVRMASDLNQDSKGSASRPSVSVGRGKITPSTADVPQVQRRNSSAYRVSLSSSAMAKGSMDRVSV
ncbi:MAG: hypothetical protein HQL67_04630 [Magnetococcales bacterium]|nr:hypothetical protein [Magnetococcales bacterium]